jgi:hypothetical protein
VPLSADMPTFYTSAFFALTPSLLPLSSASSPTHRKLTTLTERLDRLERELLPALQMCDALSTILFWSSSSGASSVDLLQHASLLHTLFQSTHGARETEGGVVPHAERAGDPGHAAEWRSDGHG